MAYVFFFLLLYRKEQQMCLRLEKRYERGNEDVNFRGQKY